MEKDKSLFETIETYFTRITTIIMICAALFIFIFWGKDTELDYLILLQIPFIGALTSIPCALLFHNDRLSRKAFLCRNILFYLYVNVLVFIFGYAFSWIKPGDKAMQIGLFFDILVVFLLVGIVSYIFDKRTSNKLNERLSLINSNDRI